MATSSRGRLDGLDLVTVYKGIRDFSIRDDVFTRENLPLVLGGANSETVIDNESLPRDGEQGEIIEEAVDDWLPENLDATVEFYGREEQRIGGKGELMDAYDYWISGYDPAQELLHGEFREHLGGGEFEIRLEDIEDVKIREFMTPKLGEEFNEKDQYPSKFRGTQDYVESVETAEPIVVIEGQYTRI